MRKAKRLPAWPALSARVTNSFFHVPLPEVILCSLFPPFNFFFQLRPEKGKKIMEAKSYLHILPIKQADSRLWSTEKVPLADCLLCQGACGLIEMLLIGSRAGV
jgi:hypothetical protein